jgi:hypothetical protein
MNEHLDTLKQRCQWLTNRIEAKSKMQPFPWDIEWDVRERDALAWALEKLEGLQ